MLYTHAAGVNLWDLVSLNTLGYGTQRVWRTLVDINQQPETQRESGREREREDTLHSERSRSRRGLSNDAGFSDVIAAVWITWILRNVSPGVVLE